MTRRRGLPRPDATAMRDDPVIEAVREVRHRISESIGHDPHRWWRTTGNVRNVAGTACCAQPAGIRASQREGAER